MAYVIYTNTSRNSLHFLSDNEAALRATSSQNALLKDTTFLRDGGTLGFGLAHKYPFSQASTDLSEVEGRLKETDAAIKRACDSLSISNEVLAVYRGGDGEVLLDHFADLGNRQIDDMTYYLKSKEGGTIIFDFPESHYGRGDAEITTDDGTPIIWVKRLAKTNAFSASYIHYGNEASFSCVYGEICLVVTVPPVEERV